MVLEESGGLEVKKGKEPKRGGREKGRSWSPFGE